MIDIFSSPNTSCQLTGTSITCIPFLYPLCYTGLLGSYEEKLTVERPSLKMLYGDDASTPPSEEFKAALGILRIG